jgi:multidrug efflux pump subunit AcrA (membrane-fusion protein)
MPSRVGDTLIALDDSELRAKREALIAQIATADAQLRNAGVQYTRELYSPRARSSPGGMGMPNLFDQFFTRPMEDFIGDRDQDAELSADLFASGTQIQEARNAMMALQAELRALDSKLRDARSVAPFDGVIVKKFIEVGDTVQPGQPLLNFADVEYLQVEVDVPARLRPGLREGMMLRAELDVPARGGSEAATAAACRCAWRRSSRWPTRSGTRSRSSSTCPRASPSPACTPRCWCRTSTRRRASTRWCRARRSASTAACPASMCWTTGRTGAAADPRRRGRARGSRC